MTNRNKNSEVLEVTNDVILRVKPEGSSMLKRFFAPLRMTKSAFTLAEVLITLAIIGVVAVLTLPNLISEIQAKHWDSASKNFEVKFEQALKVMNTQDTLAGYNSTEEFVEELGKNFRILKTCSNPTDCFVKKIAWGEQTLDLTQVTDNKSFGMKSWPNSDAIGLQFANGVSAILAYNKNCRQDKYSNQVNVTDCISMVYDTTGEDSPNENAKDIRTINVSRLLDAGCVASTPNGMCIVKAMFEPTPLDCTDSANNKYCVGTNGNSNYTSDYWAGARKTCEESGGRLPNNAELATIANDIYETTVAVAEQVYTYANFNSTKANKYGITVSYLWSSVEIDSKKTYYRVFNAGNTKLYSYDFFTRSSNYNKAICVDE